MNKKIKPTREEAIERAIPFCLSLVVIILDQITKWLVVKHIPPYTIIPELTYFDDFLRIIHARNLGAAFSMGGTWPFFIRKVIFCVIPLAVIAYVVYFSICTKEFTKLQRWCIAGIVGGGLGNLIDRIFRPLGVVDFVDVKWLGWEKAPFEFLRMTRWPTFNFADSMIVVFGIILIISFIKMISEEESSKKDTKKGK